jgi:tRNA-dihydrouridine synthase
MLPPPSERVPVILEHLDGLIALNGESVAVREMRKQLISYFKGTPQGATLKNRAMTAANRQEILAVLDEWRIYFTNYCEYS